MNHSLLLFGFASERGWRVVIIVFYILSLLYIIEGKCVKQEGRSLLELILEEVSD